MIFNVYKALREKGVRLNAEGQIHKDDIQKAEPILLKYIQASPMNVLDTEFGLDQIAKNMVMFKKLEKKKGRILKDFGEYILYEYPAYIALLHIPSQSVAYIVKFEKKKMFNKNAITQVMLWRQAGNDFVENLRIDGLKLTSYIFFKVLFASNDCIVTDSMQTGMGKRFWEDRIANALSLGFPVYYIDLNTKDKILLTPSNKNEVFETYKVWSDEENAMAKRIAICKSEFWKPTKEV